MTTEGDRYPREPAFQTLQPELERPVDVPTEAEGPGELHVDEPCRPCRDQPRGLERGIRPCQLTRDQQHGCAHAVERVSGAVDREHEPESFRPFVREGTVGSRHTRERLIGCRKPPCQVIHRRLRDEEQQGVPVAHSLVERWRSDTHALGDGLHGQLRGTAGLDQVPSRVDDLVQ